jgi:hypothetical protein
VKLFDAELVAAFKEVLDSQPPAGRQKEQVVQDYLESHTELIPTPNRLNHHLHFESVVSKFPLSTELITDYLYITKSSDTWRITMVELESPDKLIFTADTRKATPSAEFNAALNQVRSWKHFLDENKGEFLRRLEPLLQPASMRRNPVEFQYQLIIGRSTNKNLTPERKKTIRSLIGEAGIEIMTFDQLVDWYTNDQRYEKLVLRLAGVQYAFKHMHFLPMQLLSYVGPDRLLLSQEEFNRLRVAGYEVDKWRNGELLTYNWKYAASTWKEEMQNNSALSVHQKV